MGPRAGGSHPHQLTSQPGRSLANTIIFSPAGSKGRAIIELPTSHRIPVSWIKANACPPIQWRTLTELLDPGSATLEEMEAVQEAAMQYKPVLQIAKKQKDTGLWGGNLLGTGSTKDFGVKEPGTIARYRQLLELGMPPDSRALRVANRILFRVLSRDPDPELLFEYKKEGKKNPELAEWAKGFLRQGVVAALAHAGHGTDPRVRGAAKRMVNEVSAFLRSEHADNPLVKSGSKFSLNPAANPPTLFTFVAAAYMPDLHKERAGLFDKLLEFASRPKPDVNYSIVVGGSSFKPTYQVLGDPLEFESDGRPKDIPFALHWIEMLARAGWLEACDTARQTLASLLTDCDDDGVWAPKGLRSIPKSQSTLTEFAFPLEADGKNIERRKADVTFRLGLIAKISGWDLEIS